MIIITDSSWHDLNGLKFVCVLKENKLKNKKNQASQKSTYSVRNIEKDWQIRVTSSLLLGILCFWWCLEG